MGTKYVTEAIVGFNNSPPVDDGAVSEANKVKWSTTKDKLADPIKDQVANIDAKLVLMADIGPDAKTANYTTLTGDHEKTIEVTAASVTITLLAVASAPSGYTVIVKNNSGTTVDVDATGTETIDGSTSVITLADNETLIVQLDSAGTGYISLQQVALTGYAGLTSVNSFTKLQRWAKGADIASANDTVLLDDGNYNDVTGTTPINGLTDGVQNETRKLHFDGAVPLKHDTAPSAGYSKLWLTPNAADYTTAANDELEFIYDGAYWRLSGYSLASGKAIVETTQNAASDGSSLVLISSQTASADPEIDFTSGIDSTYDRYCIYLSNVIPVTDAVAFHLRVSDDGGTTFETTGYRDGLSNVGSVTLALDVDSATATGGLSGWVYLDNPASSSYYTKASGELQHWKDAGTEGVERASGMYGTASTIDAIRFFMGSGNIASGTFHLYGLKKS